jgi:hypothetical protein
VVEMVYCFDTVLHSVVKIVKRGKIWVIYRLKSVKVDRHEKPIKWTFETHAFETWDYKPFEDEDVVNEIDTSFLTDIKRWTPFIVERTVIEREQ